MEAVQLQHPGRGALPRSPRMLRVLADERLVEQLRRGNEAAFETLFDRHHRAILSFCRHMLGSREEAEDAVQQTFLSAYRSLRANDRPIKVKAWLYTIARNRCLSMLRASRAATSELVESPTAGLAEQVERRADLRQLLDDLAELPEAQRAALVLAELGDVSHAEIGEVLDCEGAKVKSLVFQARSALVEGRRARETSCREIREQLATLRGGALRRGTIRRHLKSCPGCVAFREDVRNQRRMLAVLLPVVPTLGLKETALAAVGMSAGTGGGAAGAGLIGSIAAKGGAAKFATIVVMAGGAAGGVAVTTDSDPGRRAESRATDLSRTAAPTSPAKPPVPLQGAPALGGPAPAAPDRAGMNFSDGQGGPGARRDGRGRPGRIGELDRQPRHNRPDSPGGGPREQALPGSRFEEEPPFDGSPDELKAPALPERSSHPDDLNRQLLGPRRHLRGKGMRHRNALRGRRGTGRHATGGDGLSSRSRTPR